MLSSWLRFRYPNVVDGSIAGSAPVINFEKMVPAFNYESFQATVTMDATVAGGAASDSCAANIRQSWADMQSLVAQPGGPQQLTAALRACDAIATLDDVYTVMDAASNAFGMLAMSEYPFASGYLLLGGAGLLPPYPMRVGCEAMSGALETPVARLSALGAFMAIYYNATNNQTCLDYNAAPNEATEVVDWLWGALSCSTMFMPDAQNGVTDMFWPAPWNTTAQIESCQQQYGLTPQPGWVMDSFGGYAIGSGAATNIFFSNGRLDPWSGGGILNSTAPGITTFLIEDAGHHADLFFPTANDTASMLACRAMELEMIGKWIAAKKSQ